MRVYYDFEFLEDYSHIDPISLGMFREDGKELYLIFQDCNTLAIARHGWLMKNVMKSIPHMEYTSHVTGTGQPVKDIGISDGPDVVTKQQARYRILTFLGDIDPEFWAWYGSYDHVALCSLFGRMVDLPIRWPMITLDIKQLHKQAGYPEMPKQPSGLHNALEDARFNKVRYDYLIAMINNEQNNVYDIARDRGISMPGPF